MLPSTPGELVGIKKNSDELMRQISQIKQAEKEDGGSGAFYVYLKKKL